MNTLLILFGILVFGYVIWISFFRPYNVVKDHTEFGYNINNGRNDVKRAAVNMALRRRKRGNLPPPYPNSWYSILESSCLKRGDVKEIYVLSHNLVVWRGKASGQAFVADAYCPHLGAHLGVGGTVIEDCIQCPFHQWSFDGCSGKVHDIPYSSSNLKNLSNFGSLKMWKVKEANGFIYIWYHVEGNEPSWFPEEIEGMSSRKWKYHGRSEFSVTCHIQEIPENGADVAHLAVLHESPAILQASPTIVNFLGNIVKHKWTATWTPNSEIGKEHESIIDMTHHLNLFGGVLSSFHLRLSAKQYGAGIVIMKFSMPFWEGVLVQNVTPVEPLLQKITHRFYSSSRLYHLLGVYILHGEGIHISRDIEIWNRKCYLHKPLLVKEDEKIKLFRRWYSQFYSNNDTSTAVATLTNCNGSKELW